jgi:hypothetical protein
MNAALDVFDLPDKRRKTSTSRRLKPTNDNHPRTSLLSQGYLIMRAGVAMLGVDVGFDSASLATFATLDVMAAETLTSGANIGNVDPD